MTLTDEERRQQYDEHHLSVEEKRIAKRHARFSKYQKYTHEQRLLWESQEQTQMMGEMVRRLTIITIIIVLTTVLTFCSAAVL